VTNGCTGGYCLVSLIYNSFKGGTNCIPNQNSSAYVPLGGNYSVHFGVINPGVCDVVGIEVEPETGSSIDGAFVYINDIEDDYAIYAFCSCGAFIMLFHSTDCQLSAAHLSNVDFLRFDTDKDVNLTVTHDPSCVFYNSIFKFNNTNIAEIRNDASETEHIMTYSGMQSDLAVFFNCSCGDN